MKARRVMVAAIAVVLSVVPLQAYAAETETMLVSSGRNGASTGYKAALHGVSGTGRFVLFDSRSPRLVRGDKNNARDAFVWDRETGTTERVNVSSDGRQTLDGGCECGIATYPIGISDDGDVVLFFTASPTLVAGDEDSNVDGFVHVRSTGKTTLITRSKDEDSLAYPLALSPDGRFVAYRFHENRNSRDHDLILFDRQTGQRSTMNDETPGHAAFDGHVVAISEGGSRVTFVSNDPALGGSSTPTGSRSYQVFVLDRSTDSIQQVSVSSDELGANNSSDGGATSPDGRYVAFESTATNLAPGEDLNATQDVYVRDLREGTTTLVTVGTMGLPANRASWADDISDDGCRVLFESEATNLVEGDTNERIDVFLGDSCAATTTRVSVSSSGAQGDYPSWGARLSGNGLWAGFKSRATNLAPADRTYKYDVFLRGAL